MSLKNKRRALVIRGPTDKFDLINNCLLAF